MFKIGGNMKYKAVFKRWNGDEDVIYVEKNLIEDIVFAVESQMKVKSKNTIINGAKYCKVDVYEC